MKCEFNIQFPFTSILIAFNQIKGGISKKTDDNQMDLVGKISVIEELLKRIQTEFTKVIANKYNNKEHKEDKIKVISL